MTWSLPIYVWFRRFLAIVSVCRVSFFLLSHQYTLVHSFSLSLSGFTRAPERSRWSKLRATAIGKLQESPQNGGNLGPSSMITLPPNLMPMAKSGVLPTERSSATRSLQSSPSSEVHPSGPLRVGPKTMRVRRRDCAATSSSRGACGGLMLRRLPARGQREVPKLIAPPAPVRKWGETPTAFVAVAGPQIPRIAQTRPGRRSRREQFGPGKARPPHLPTPPRP